MPGQQNLKFPLSTTGCQFQNENKPLFGGWHAEIFQKELEEFRKRNNPTRERCHQNLF
jgi:hypothetical protein